MYCKEPHKFKTALRIILLTISTSLKATKIDNAIDVNNNSCIS